VCTDEATVGAGAAVQIAVGIEAQVQFAGSAANFAPYTITSNYLGSAVLTSVTVTDTNGNPLSPSLLESSNGTLLTPDGYAGTVPEPASFTMLGGGIAVLALARRRKGCFDSARR
jgi:hypothetical protein